MSSILVCIGYFKPEADFEDPEVRDIVNLLKFIGEVGLAQKGNEKEVVDLHCGRLTTTLTKEAESEEKLIAFLQNSLKQPLEKRGLVFVVGNQLPLKKEHCSAP